MIEPKARSSIYLILLDMVWNNKLIVYFNSIEILNLAMLKFAYTVSKTIIGY